MRKLCRVCKTKLKKSKTGLCLFCNGRALGKKYGPVYGPINGKILGKKYGPIYGKIYGPIYGPRAAKAAKRMRKIRKQMGHIRAGQGQRVKALLRKIDGLL